MASWKYLCAQSQGSKADLHGWVSCQGCVLAGGVQGEMINESGTMSGGGGKPRGGRMCIGNAAPKNVDARAAAAELQAAEQELNASMQVRSGLGRA